MAFRAATYTILHDGRSALFWTDRWIPGGIAVGDIAPELLNAMGRTRRRRSVAGAIAGNAWVSDITGVRTVRVVLGYLRLWEIVRETWLVDGLDQLIWRWSSDTASTRPPQLAGPCS